MTPSTEQFDSLPIKLRDWFAGQALIGLVNLPQLTDQQRVRRAYQLADAMMKQGGYGSKEVK